jgi:hypothetical protein
LVSEPVSILVISALMYATSRPAGTEPFDHARSA